MPWLDVTCADPAERALDRKDPLLLIPLLKEGQWYAGKVPLTDPRVSPIHADVAGLPLMLLMTGHDLLNAYAHPSRCKGCRERRTLRMVDAPNMLHV